MSCVAYYNENDPFAAEWLRNLIAGGHIAPGDVDERDIRDVVPAELVGYTQCHFFAGIGGWSHALRLAGWPDDEPVWTGSCPCQPFSAAGRGGGFGDERHLWPAFFWLISQSRPSVVFGEQVAGPAGLAWLDVVSADLEALLYAVAAADLPAAGVGAPHIRQRLWFVADAQRSGRQPVAHGDGCPDAGMEAARQGLEPRQHGDGSLAVAHPLPAGRAEGRPGAGNEPIARGAAPGNVAFSNGFRRNGGAAHAEQPAGTGAGDAGSSASLSLANPEHGGREGREPEPRRDGQDAGSTLPPSAAGPWSDLEWLPCRDGKARPVEPGLFPLAHGVSGRVGLLRGAGNAIVPQIAATFIAAYLDTTQAGRCG